MYIYMYSYLSIYLSLSLSISLSLSQRQQIHIAMYVFSFWGKPSGILMDDDLPIGNGDVHQFSLVLLAYHSDSSRSMGHALPGTMT